MSFRTINYATWHYLEPDLNLDAYADPDSCKVRVPPAKGSLVISTASGMANVMYLYNTARGSTNLA